MSASGHHRHDRARVLARGLLAVALALTGNALAAQAPPSDDAIKMGSPPALPQGVGREEMWPAATAEQWKLPVLVPWQRTWEDALRVARETERPILVCVNMDGEIASEHYAGIRYREAESAKLLEPYACVIASVYRHTPRDHDAQGNRVPCPRFGGVTCGEHIAMESLLYEKFFDGQRIAPRHILVELDGKETYDVYYSWDTATVFTAWKKGAENRPPPRLHVRGDTPIVERTDSADSGDRLELESTYQRGSREVRRALLESALKHRDVDQIDMLRIAIFGLDVDLARLARKALAQSTTEGAIELIAEVLKSPLDASERAELLAAAARLAEQYPQARTLVAVQQGLARSSRFVDVLGWAGAGGASYAHAVSIESRAASFEARPDDPEAKLGMAEAMLARAQDPATEPRFAEVFLADARDQAQAAEKLGAKGWRLDALLAVSASARGDRDEALARAQAAIEGGMPRPGASAGDASVDERTAVQVLALFAQARQRAIGRAYRERAQWPPEWLADVTSVYAVLVRHPLGTETNVADGYDFLRWLGATPRAVQMLEDGLARFPDSWMLHERLRARILWESGPEGLEAAYAQRLARAEATPAPSGGEDPDRPGATLRWFAGYASLVAAEHHRRSGAPAKALGAYERAIELYRRDLELHPERAESAAHYVAMAHGGRARIDLEQGELEAALRELLAAFQGAPDSAATLDGLNISPVDTANMLLARLDAAPRADLAGALRAALAALDPRMLELPAYEREVPTAPVERERPRREGR